MGNTSSETLSSGDAKGRVFFFFISGRHQSRQRKFRDSTITSSTLNLRASRVESPFFLSRFVQAAFRASTFAVIAYRAGSLSLSLHENTSFSYKSTTCTSLFSPSGARCARFPRFSSSPRHVVDKGIPSKFSFLSSVSTGIPGFKPRARAAEMRIPRGEEGFVATTSRRPES